MCLNFVQFYGSHFPFCILSCGWPSLSSSKYSVLYFNGRILGMIVLTRTYWRFKIIEFIFGDGECHGCLSYTLIIHNKLVALTNNSLGVFFDWTLYMVCGFLCLGLWIYSDASVYIKPKACQRCKDQKAFRASFARNLFTPLWLIWFVSLLQFFTDFIFFFESQAIP